MDTVYFCNLGVCFLCFYQGDLHEFLICHSPRSDVSACSDDGNVHVLEQPEFLHISMQIAAGKSISFTILVEPQLTNIQVANNLYL